MKQVVYAFSGLGADKRIFSKLDLEDFLIIHIDWLQPEVDESLAAYVLRLAAYYAIPQKGAFVIGVSFGGICIVELAKTYDFGKIVLLSSAKTKDELPRYYFLLKYLPFYKWIPSKLLTKTNVLMYWFFTVDRLVDRQLLKEIIKDTNPIFLKWAIECITHWDNAAIPMNYLHIHGDRDRIIPLLNVDHIICISGGGHLMTLNKGKEISFHIRNYLFD